MARGIVYLITNKENGLKYVGSTLQPMNKEWQYHIQLANKMSNEPLHKAFRKYGIHRFGIQELDEHNEEGLEDRKKHWIQYYNSYHGENYNYRIFDQEDEEDIIPIIPNKIRETRQLHTFTEQDRKLIKHCGHKVQGKNINTNETKIWNSAAEAASEVANSPRKNSNIMKCARNCYSCYGYKWSLIEENPKKKPVFSIHKKTERLGPRYESITEATNALRGTGSGTGLIKSLRNPGHYSYRGFYWYYG